MDLPAHELEIDIDIETSASDRVYLWGFGWTTPPPLAALRAVQLFTDLDAEAEAALATAAFTWIRDTIEAGRRPLPLLGLRGDPDQQAGRALRGCRQLDGRGRRERFVDLFRLMSSTSSVASGLGLKVVATATTGFEWRDSEPGGLNSQTWFNDAVTGSDVATRENARQRVLEYNEDDVRATWHLRRWLRSLG